MKPRKPRTQQRGGKLSSPALLEHGNLRRLRESKKKTAQWLTYHWQRYSELAQQRNSAFDELRQALTTTCRSNFSFDRWQRAVPYKYSLHPLCTLGSVSYVGGRFNIGREINSEVQVFQALYIATDKDTVLQEALGQAEKSSDLTARELALSNPQSETVVSVSGTLETVFDLSEPNNLKPFVEIIKHFTLSAELLKLGKALELPNPGIITTPSVLKETLLDPNWRFFPVQCDVPSNSQILGHILFQAGIEGVLYSSKLNGKPCLAIFPHNFEMSSSFIKMDDDAPHKTVPARIDATNWRLCEMPYEDVRRRK